ncbi:MAG: SCO family protein [Solirubrobacteraceae bacterium]|nr:SCO family protein [Solirubrobacteraceae bacterium]
MPARIRLTVIGFGMLFMAVLTLWLVSGAPGLQRTTNMDVTNGFAGSIRPEIPVKPIDGVHDEYGKPLSVQRGDVTVVTFLYTSCQDTCPTTAQQIRGALDRLERAPHVIALSVDPLNDTEKSAKAFLAEQSLLGRAHFALGPPVALRRAWDYFGVAPQTAESDHTAQVILLDREGRQRIGFPADKLTPEALAHDVEALRAES